MPPVETEPSTSGAPPNVPLEVFRQAVEQAALAISITDPQARIVYANGAFQRVTGYDGAEVVGQKESILSYRVTPKLVYETMWAQLIRQRAWNGLLVNRRKDGSRYLADLTITPVIDAQGHTSHYLGMHRDVTEVHRLERQVQNQKGRLESLVDAAQVAIVMLDEQDRVVLDNHEYKKHIGELGPEPAQALLAELRTRLGGAFDTARHKGHALPAQEIHLDLPRGRRRWFACSISWIDELEGGAEAFYAPRPHKYLLLTFQDITPLKQQQETIRINALRALLAEQERIQSLREALSGAVFQLQGPFNMLAAALRMLERRAEAGHGDHSDPVLASLQEAQKAGSEALETLRACIPVEAIEATGPVNLNQVLQDVLHLATARLLADGVVVEWQPDAALPPISGRQHQLTTLFKHLLDNALEAIHESRRQHRDLKITTAAHADHVEAAIADSGPGIPEEWRLKAFEPFFTTKGADHQHIGMGLTVAQEIVAGHGGFIEIDPHYNSGCRLRVQIPRERT
jgi:nitrogen fixation negative regulator NifL